MKKILLIIMLLLVIFNCFSDNVLDLDGRFWTGLNDGGKYLYTLGYVSAHSALILAVVNLLYIDNIITDNEQVIKYLYIDKSVEIIIDAINYYYDVTEDYDAQIWSVIYFMYHKGWWDTESPSDIVRLFEDRVKSLHNIYLSACN